MAISQRSDGRKSKPSKYASVPDDQFADRTNWEYPIDTEEHVRAALSYWGKAANRSKYSSADQTTIGNRIKRRAKELGIDVQADFSADNTHSEIRNMVATALGVPSYHIEDMYDDAAIHTMPKNPTGRDLYESDGKLYRTPYSILDGKITLGDRQEVKRRTVYDPVSNFSVAFSAGTAQGSLVPYTGKVFEIGDYPDKHFSITPEEADALSPRAWG